MARSGGKHLGLPIGLVLRIAVWVIATLWLGTVACWHGVRLVRRLPVLLSGTLRCPRGHAVAAFGAWSCGVCRYTFEGYAFARCPSCHGLASYVICQTCGLGIRDPHV